MFPIQTKESNFAYLGPTAAIADLPCRVVEGNTFSIWELTDDERRLIAAGANVRLGIYQTRPIPPVSLQVVVNDGDFAKVGSQCHVCGKDSGDPVHGTDEGCHAFKLGPGITRRR